MADQKSFTHYWVQSGLFLVVFLLHLAHLSPETRPSLMPDELGYLGVAAWFVGIDWSGVIQGIPNYSPGYSLLITPIFWLFDTPATVYRGVLVLNIVLVSLMSVVAFRVSLKLFPDIRLAIRTLAVLAVSFYPAHIVYASFAMTESLLFLLYWISVWMVSRISEKATPVQLGALGMLTGSMYMVHPRGGVFVLAGSVVVLLLVWTRRVSQPGVVAFCLSSAIVLIGTSLTQAHLHEVLWKGQVESYGARLAFFTGEGLARLMVATAGQAFYLGAAGLLATFVGLAWAIGRIPQIGRRPPPPASVVLTTATYVLASSIGTFVVSAVFLSLRATRGDHLIFGRYNEIISGPLILAGILYACQRKDSLKRNLKWGYGVLTGLLGVMWILGALELWGYPVIHLNVPGFFLFRWPGGELNMAAVFAMAFITSVVFWWGIARSPHAGLVGCFLMFLLCGNRMAQEWVWPETSVRSEQRAISGWLQKNSRLSEVGFTLTNPEVDESYYERRAMIQRTQFDLWRIRLVGKGTPQTATSPFWITPDHIPPDLPGAATLVAQEPNGLLYLWSVREE